MELIEKKVIDYINEVDALTPAPGGGSVASLVGALGVSLANSFIGGGQGPEFAKKVSKFVSRVAKKVAAEVLSALTEGTTQELTDALEKYEWYRDKMDVVKQVKSKVNDKLNELAGYNDD